MKQAFGEFLLEQSKNMQEEFFPVLRQMNQEELIAFIARLSGVYHWMEYSYRDTNFADIWKETKRMLEASKQK